MSKSTTRIISPEEYEKLFKDKEIAAHKQALDIRKFEIELYWKRATYFWTFIGATLAGFISVNASSSENKADLLVMLSSLGFVFSSAWFLVNRGSKYWQENWEKHVDVLEDSITGPLYKVTMTRSKDITAGQYAIHLVTGPSPISVSKINQIISLYVVVLWVVLLVNSLPQAKALLPENSLHMSLVSISVLAIVGFLWLGRSYGHGAYHAANLRKSRIKPKDSE